MERGLDFGHRSQGGQDKKPLRIVIMIDEYKIKFYPLPFLFEICYFIIFSASLISLSIYVMGGLAPHLK